MGVVLLLFCQPVMAAYQQPYYSHEYQNLSEKDKQTFDSALKAGDAYYQNGDYTQALLEYNQAVTVSGGQDYTAQAAVGQADLAVYKKTGNKMYLSMAKEELSAAQVLLQKENPGGYEENDLMAKIRTSQAEMHRFEGNEDAARISEQEAADYRNKANESEGYAGIPFSPLTPLLGLGITGAFAFYQARRK